MSGKLIACLGGAGAPGVTTIACQLAHAFSAGAKLDVALIDMDMDHSPLGAIMEVNETAAMSKLYALTDIGALGDDVVELAMQSAGEHLRVVTGFRGTELGPGFKPSQGLRVIHGLSARNDICILDIGRPRVWSAFELLRDFDVLCWVVTPTPEGAYHWRHIWDTVEGRGLPRNRMVAVINQYDHPRALAEFPEQWMEDPGIPIVAKIPYLPKLDPIDLTRQVGGRLGKKRAPQWVDAYDSFVSRIAGTIPTYEEVGNKHGLFGGLRRSRGDGN